MLRDRIELISVALLGAFLTIGQVGSALAERNADFFIRDYEGGDKTTRTRIEQFLSDNHNGLAWANAFLGSSKQQKLFCPPPRFAPTGSDLLAIVKRQVTAKPSIGEMPFGLALLTSLRSVFPCQSQT